ncbi:hypothetical protein SR870_07785 [Rhodopseudomonas palustris]|uniref:hypothetical protein n=1 Tax=Rhodopseudomonas palustris TaxID=1076 RepID=UPI002ACEBF0D|nr:hypothetical protein [Rhodopseudomonas palustris]WQH01165.1 hypothetical protein SR870_07785 [Rhodopseudomonas palustris]
MDYNVGPDFMIGPAFDGSVADLQRTTHHQAQAAQEHVEKPSAEQKTSGRQERRAPGRDLCRLRCRCRDRGDPGRCARAGRGPGALRRGEGRAAPPGSQRFKAPRCAAKAIQFEDIARSADCATIT